MTLKCQKHKAHAGSFWWCRASLIMCAGLIFTQVNANKIIDVDHVGIQVRLGYSIGGTSPLPLPAGIRKLNNYTFQPNLHFGFDVTHNVTEHVGVLFGIHYENKGMHVDADVKNYHEEIVRGGESLAGQFTGCVTTKVREWMLTVPIQATYNFNDKVVLRFGPYFSLLTDKSFTGYAHNGYLRQDDPTGPKIVLGDTRETRGDFDFSANMRDLQWGLDLGADWYVYKRWASMPTLAGAFVAYTKSRLRPLNRPFIPSMEH